LEPRTVPVCADLSLFCAGRGLPLQAGPGARRLLARLDARPLATRAAPLGSLVGAAGGTFILKTINMLDSADIEVTDSRLPHTTVVEHQPQAGDLILHINGESTQGLTHAQAVDRIRTGGSRLRLVLQRPNETQTGKHKGIGGSQKGSTLSFTDCRPDLVGPAMMKSHNASLSPVHHPQFNRTPKTRGSPEPSPEAAVDAPAVPPAERYMEDPDDGIPGSPGPWLVPSEERLLQALGLPRAAQLAQETAAGRRRH
uniref:MAGI family member, X-linked n=1 Tax=Spermophilus dauricus TaxID=99837 RepID=A0A8C9UN76_SPEDA